MPPKKQTRGTPHLHIPAPRGIDPQVVEYVESLRRQAEFWLIRVTEGIDQNQGARGTPTILADVDFKGNRPKNLGIPTQGSDAIRADLVLRRPGLGAQYYDAGDLPIRSSARSEHPRDVVIREEVREVEQKADAANQTTQELQGELDTLTDTVGGLQTQIDALETGQVTLDTAQTITGLKTFSRGAAAPFAVASTSNVLVGNLNADLWDSQNYTTGTFTPTIVGFATPPVITCAWVKLGAFVSLVIPTISATSNATNFQILGLSAEIIPTRQFDVFVQVRDNGAATVVGVVRFSAGSANVTVYPSLPTPTVPPWTASGAKILYISQYNYSLL